MKTGTRLIAVILVLAAGTTHADDTELTIRARAVDAKFIGSGVGGIDVVISEADTGEVLDRGRITGGTGDTARLMTTPEERGMRLSTEDTAGYRAILDIEEPTRVAIRLRGPLDGGENVHEAEKTVWVLPGRHVRGDGIVFDMPGLIVDGELASTAEGSRLTANVMMLCGCPLSDGGLWDSNEFEVRARAMNGDALLDTLSLSFTGNTSEFAWQGRLPEGTDRVVLWAHQTTTGNTGVATITP